MSGAGVKFFVLKDAMKIIAACAYVSRATALFGVITLGLVGCSALQPAARPVVYDFGPGALAPAAVTRQVNQPALVLADVVAPGALDGTAVLYRLAYSDTQQLRPYAQARWSMPPAQLLRQRMREQLGQRRTVLNPEQGVLAPGSVMTLHVELEEFSQLFEAADRSSGLLRLRATLGVDSAGGEQLVAQRNFVVQRPSASADAAGGVRALTVATDAILQELEQWVQQVEAAPKK